VSLTLLLDNFTGTGNLVSPWTAVSRTWASSGLEYVAGGTLAGAPTVSGGALVVTSASGAQGATPATMGKAVLATDWFGQLAGDATNNKVGEVACDLVWRNQTDQFTYTAGGSTTTIANHTTYVGLVIAGTTTGVGAYAVLVTRTGGASPWTTGRLVRVDTSSTFAVPTFTDIGGAAVTLPNATNGERWNLRARVTWFAPTFSLASILATFTDATGAEHSIGLPTAQNAGTYGTNTGQGILASWTSGQLYAGFLNRPGSRVLIPSSYVAANQFERLRVRDVGALANLTTATPSYALSAPVTYSAATVSTETNASAYTLSVQPSWTQETIDDYQVATFRADSGDRVAFPLTTKRRRRWAFRWTALDDSEKATLATLTADVKGRFSTWSWTDPETALAVSVRFTSDVEFAKIGPGAWSAAASVEEVL